MKLKSLTIPASIVYGWLYMLPLAFFHNKIHSLAHWLTSAVISWSSSAVTRNFPDQVLTIKLFLLILKSLNRHPSSVIIFSPFWVMSTWLVAYSSVTHLHMQRHCRYSLINPIITLITHLKPRFAGNLENIIIFFPRGGVRVGVCVDAQEAVADVRELEIQQWKRLI